MRRRSASVFWRSDPVSTTWTTPYDVSMARSAAATDSEGRVVTARKAAPVKWTWLFQKPAVTVPPEQSMTRAFGGTWTTPRGPTAVMRASSTRTTPSGIAAACGDGNTRPPTNASTRAPAIGVVTGAGPHAAASTAAVASAAAPRIPRPRSRVEDILRQEGGHHEVGDLHHVAEPEVDGHAAELSAEPTLLQETHHAEDGVATGQVEILTLVDPRLRHGHTHGGGVLSGPVRCQTSRPTVAGRCGVVNRLDNLCRHPTRAGTPHDPRPPECSPRRPRGGARRLATRSTCRDSTGLQGSPRSNSRKRLIVSGDEMTDQSLRGGSQPGPHPSQRAGATRRDDMRELRC